jgi:hypothetical protein
MLTLGDPTIGFPVDGEETKAASRHLLPVYRH